MMNMTVKRELIDQVEQLDYEQQRRVLDFARALAVTAPKGIPGKQLLAFSGKISVKDLKVMGQSIKDNCEKVDLNEW